jgi:hypothetical protein
VSLAATAVGDMLQEDRRQLRTRLDRLLGNPDRERPVALFTMRDGVVGAAVSFVLAAVSWLVERR